MAKKSILREFMNTDIEGLGFNNNITNIHYQKIKEAVKNRSLRRIQELAEDIATDGLEDNLVVRKIEDPEFEYELIAGHRRFNAICHNIENGDMTYEYIPCKVTNMDDMDARRRLILNNYNADPLTEAEKLDAIEELRDIYRIKKENGEKVPGRIQELIANDIGLKKSQVGNYEKIINNTIPEVREKIADGEMTITAAAELSSLAEDEQFMFIENKDSMDLKTVKEYKKELEQDKADDDPFASSNFNLRSADIEEEEIFEPDFKTYEYIEDDNQNNQHSSKHTITQSLKLIESEIDCLKSKMDPIEFQAETGVLQEFVTSFHKLKNLLKI